jgi:hypothetical protein
VFGASKTWRGVVVAVIGCVAGVALQKYVLRGWPSALALVDYDAVQPLVFGAALGIGAMVGELPNSFAKRQLGIPPGKTTSGPLAAVFFVLDQVDLLLGAWPLIACWVRPTFSLVLASFVLALAAHPLVSVIGYAVGARASAR